MNSIFDSELENLQQLSVSSEQLKLYQVLCLPENLGRTKDIAKLFDSPGSINLSKLLKQNGLKCANTYDLNLTIPSVERRSGDIWLGLVWILDNIALPLVLGIISSIVGSIVIANSKRPDKSNSDVHISLEIQHDKDAFTRFDYDGDAKILIKILNGLNSNEDKGDTNK
jgi:hypothetical protein